MKKILLLSTLLLTSLSVHANPQAEALFQTINDRLSYMEDVALFKANNHLAIEDIEREEVVLNNAVKSAGDYGLAPQQVKDFFAAQVSVAKAIQYRHRADWLSQPANNEPRDLKTVIRPALLTLGNQINEQLSDYVKHHGQITAEQSDLFNQVITIKYVSNDDKSMLFNALKKVDIQ
ncbi:chorismate mutase [Photobacterium makurazakiensis]|uniref:chorismate mutase n=1 Tax=Photobacterium makurazakiensis TaxID=2910234 RepID=UPI003D0BD5F7